MLLPILLQNLRVGNDYIFKIDTLHVGNKDYGRKAVKFALSI
jgi:hypothetical protein